MLETTSEPICNCRKCPRLVEWREGAEARAPKRFQGQSYWGRPAPDFGATNAKGLIVGLAPAANGANRTGRLFTGDDSGDWLFRALYNRGLCNSPRSESLDDGLELYDVSITCVLHCAPPDNKPLPIEVEACAPYLAQALAKPEVQSILCLGGIAWNSVCRWLQQSGRLNGKALFGHGASFNAGSLLVVGSYHPSRQNTSTKRLTMPMLEEAIALFQSGF